MRAYIQGMFLRKYALGEASTEVQEEGLGQETASEVEISGTVLAIA